MANGVFSIRYSLFALSKARCEFVDDAVEGFSLLPLRGVAGTFDHLTALPRISLNGNYQDKRFLSVLTSGAATAVWNGFRRVAAA